MNFFKEAINTLQALVGALGGGRGTWDDDTTTGNRPVAQRRTSSRRNKNGGLIALARPPPRSPYRNRIPNSHRFALP